MARLVEIKLQEAITSTYIQIRKLRKLSHIMWGFIWDCVPSCESLGLPIILQKSDEIIVL